MRAPRWVATGLVCTLVLGACSVPAPAETRAPDGGTPLESASPISSPTPVESYSPGATGTPPASARSSGESDDPAHVLTGRAVEALGTLGADVVMRIGAPGFRLPEGERLYNLHDDRVLSVIANSEGGEIARMIVRDLSGAFLREIDTGMQIPQTGIIRGDDVYYGGIEFGENGDPFTAMDRGAWVVHGDAPPEPLIAAREGLAIYHAFERSPDGRTVGVSHCWENACSTTLFRQGSAPVDIPTAGLIAMTNEVALLIGRFSDVTAYAISDGAELWRAETEGIYYFRYATSDGARIVMSSIEDADDDDGRSSDQMRIEVWDALTGTVERTVLVSTDETLFTLQPTLSSDRYVALFDGVIPDTDEGSKVVQIIDLEAGELLDVQLAFGPVP